MFGRLFYESFSVSDSDSEHDYSTDYDNPTLVDRFYPQDISPRTPPELHDPDLRDLMYPDHELTGCIEEEPSSLGSNFWNLENPSPKEAKSEFNDNNIHTSEVEFLYTIENDVIDLTDD